MIRVAFIALALVLVAMPAVAAAPSAATIISLPEIGKEAEVEIGTTMVSAARVQTTPSITTTSDYSGSALTIRAGVMTFEGWDLEGKFFISPRPAVSKFIGITTLGRGGIYVYDDGSRPSQIYWIGPAGKHMSYHADQTIQFTLTNTTDVQPTNFKQELVYAGVSHGVVSLTYREFSGDLARPAFTQDLSYDLAEGEEIGFRGARFKVIKATNTTIRYVVLRPLQGVPAP